MMRVLVIEDNEDFRKLALMWFQSCGIEVEGAANVRGRAPSRRGEDVQQAVQVRRVDRRSARADRGLTFRDRRQSTLIFASRMTSVHLRSSAFTTRSSSSGVEPTGSPPCSSSFCFTSGSWITCAISFCIRATIAGGVFAGANIAYQESTS